MKIVFSKFIAGAFAIGFLLGMATLLPVAADEIIEEGFISNPNRIQGLIDSVGKDFIVIKDRRLDLSPNAVFYNEEGGKVVDGKKKLRPELLVDLNLKKGKVVEVIIYGLLMR